MKVPTASSEAQLEQLRREAEINGRVSRPFPTTSYYELPLLKPPVWTWEVPAYFFVVGAAAVIGVMCGAADPAAIDPSTAESAVPHRGHR